jgi:protein-disulfide isomerase
MAKKTPRAVQPNQKATPASSKAPTQRRPPARAAASQKRFYATLGTVAAAAAIFLAWQLTKPGPVVPPVDTSTPLPEAAGYWLGDKTAPVSVIAFGDFECPSCASFHTLSEPDVRKLVDAGTISYRFFDLPLAIHLNTWPASNAAACANEQGKFWEFHNELFNGQDAWNASATRRPKGVFKGYAGRIGLDVGRWEKCFDTQRYLRNIQANAREGERRLVSSTPTFIIGKRVVGNVSSDTFKAYVDSALADVRQAGDQGR